MNHSAISHGSGRGRRSWARSAGSAGVILAAASVLLSACSSSPVKADPPTSTSLQITTTTVAYVPTYDGQVHVIELAQGKLVGFSAAAEVMRRLPTRKAA